MPTVKSKKFLLWLRIVVVILQSLVLLLALLNPRVPLVFKIVSCGGIVVFVAGLVGVALLWQKIARKLDFYLERAGVTWQWNRAIHFLLTLLRLISIVALVAGYFYILSLLAYELS